MQEAGAGQQWLCSTARCQQNLLSRQQRGSASREPHAEGFEQGVQLPHVIQTALCLAVKQVLLADACELTQLASLNSSRPRKDHSC